mmetsp:Transcript_28965/g.58335  ORF Transcript_28965/g.58335 Transcript_28965/m.58335 type:complete len:259 (-) Transcript_28965:125-901(-)
MWLHIVRPILMMLVATLGLRYMPLAAWRLAVGLLQAAFCAYDMVVLPVARQQATLYTNLGIAAHLLLASVSPRRAAWVWHSASFISAHSLLIGYVMALYAAGDNLVHGFDVIDVTQWMGSSAFPEVEGAVYSHLRTVPMACEASFVLHVMPLVLVHLDLRANKATLAAAYAGAGLRSHIWSVTSAFIIPLTYQAVLTAIYGNIERALTTLYRIKPENVAALILGSQAMNMSLAGLAYYYVRSFVGSHTIEAKSIDKSA